MGEYMLSAVPSLAKNMAQYQLLERVLADREGREVHFFSSFTTRGNSDFRSFKCGVGISAYRRMTGIGYITTAIHTKRDTVADQGNLDFLAGALAETVHRL